MALTAMALVAGALFSFSAFVMRSLGRLEPGEGLRAMQRVNEAAPRNNDLAALDAGEPRTAGEWAAYRVSWTRWNHVRVVAALGSAVLLAAPLHR